MKRFLLALVCAAAILRAQPGQASAYVIAGTVVNALSKTPIPKALVRINLTQTASGAQNSNSRLAITGDDGRFAFLNVPAGKYQLSAAKPNDRPQFFLADGNQFSTAIVTGPKLDTAHLVFPYHTAGGIDGTVIDENGEPVRNAQIYVFRHDTIDGRLQYVRAGQTNTHGDGLFHLGHLIAGNYLVAVAATPWFSNRGLATGGRPLPTQPAAELDVAYPFTYYPGTAEPSDAGAIPVSEGSTSKIQIPLRSVPAIHPSFDLPTPVNQPNAGPIPPQQYVQLAAIGPDNMPIVTHVINGGPGFSQGIAPGRYRVTQGGMSNGEYSMKMSKPVDITNDGPLPLETVSQASIAGTVSIEGVTGKPANPVVVMLAPVSGGPPLRAQTAKDLTFKFPDGIAPGRYRILLPNSHFFLKSIAAKSADVSGGQVDLPPDATVQLSLVMSPFSNSKLPLQGIALRNGKPQAEAMVLLFPVQSGSIDQIRRDQSDFDGSFSLGQIPPGDYRLLAIENARDLEYRDPKAIAPYLPKSKSVKIGATTPPPTDLKVVIQPRQP